MKNSTIWYFFLCMLFCALLDACKEHTKQHKDAASDPEAGIFTGYDMSKGEEITMKKKLSEISGIHYLKQDAVVAIQDEKGVVYTVDLTTGDISDEYRFGGPGDYEDITMDTAFYYVLESNGSIYKIARNGSGAAPQVFPFTPGKKMEFESLYLDPDGKDGILICKRCHGEGKSRVIHAYRFTLENGRFSDEPAFSLDWSAVHEIVGEAEARPSAAAIHPLSKKLYVLCSVGKLLLVCTLQGKVEHAFPLDPSLFKQPEGITFSPAGDMFISNEAGEGQANIIRFPFKP